MSKASNPAVAAAWISGGLGCIAAIVVAIISLIAVIIQVSKPDPTVVVPTNPPPATQPGPTQSETTLTVINKTSEDICYLYVAPAGSTTLGPGWLDAGATIAPNKGLRLELETGMYDLRAENCAREAIAETPNNHIEGDMHWVVENVASTSSDTVLEVINNTSEDVCYLYISPSTSDDDWGDNWISESERISVGQKMTFSMETGMYDVRAETCQEEVLAEFFDNHLQGNMEWELVK